MEGEESSDILELAAEPGFKGWEHARPLGLIRYSLEAGISGDSFFVTGTLEADFELECVACLEQFRYPLRIDRFAFQMDIGGSETIDLTPAIREDILLVLPSYPHCDWDGERTCKGPRVIRKMKNESQESQAPRAWDALDKLKTGKNYGSTQT